VALVAVAVRGWNPLGPSRCGPMRPMRPMRPK
jgi:hypothetical protein